ncbi:hypothetical protein DL93DRAFT_2107033 [Clavulina sp. PMI_390]|nr:hypothetical protein DL93DRAFT_2107033 [Clavulina sp. PMI_390]
MHGNPSDPQQSAMSALAAQTFLAHVICEGWVLKKRRKKMQGFARRYFVLKTDGVLMYSTQPGSTPRDSIPLRLATITSSGRSDQITVDSGTKTFHIRCFTPGDFNKWMTAFRTFEAPAAGEGVDPDDTATERGSISGGSTLHNYADRLMAIVHQMDLTIAELEATTIPTYHHPPSPNPELNASTLSKKRSTNNLRSKKEKEEKDGHHGKGDHGLFKVFHRKGSNNSVPTEHTPSDTPPLTLNGSTRSGGSTPSSQNFPFSLPSTSSATSPTSLAPAQTVQTLRRQHIELMSLCANFPFPPPSEAPGQSFSPYGMHELQRLPSPTSRGIPLDRLLTTQLSSGNISALTPRSMASRSSFAPLRRPMSLNTVGSGGDSIFFDAEDGGLEFIDIDGDEEGSEDSVRTDAQRSTHAPTIILDKTTPRPSLGPSSEEPDEITIPDEAHHEDDLPTPISGQHPQSQEARPSSASMTSSTSSSSASTGSPDPGTRPTLGSVLSNVSSSSTVSMHSSIPEHGSTPATAPPGKAVVVRRTALPAPTSGEQMSLFTMLKRNIGKDLATVAFPVTFNEPLSLLQHAAEDLEYLDVIEKAVEEKDPVVRLAFVAAFAVSGYACTKLRASRKPFNPLLGETFEDIRYNFVSEKVSHHPPVVACHAHGDGWEFWSTSGAKNKFWGKSLEIIPVGTTYLKIGDETYSWQKPSSFMRNLIAGEKYLEHCGFMTIHTSSSSLHCTLEFKEGGFWGTNKDEVFGKIIGAEGHNDVELRGRWNTGMSRFLDPFGSHLHVLWRAAPLPDDAIDYYGFTHFAIELNETTDDIRDFIPPTDSRLRPDQRALENGNVELAESEKARVEEAQRERRKARADNGETYTPKWFRPKAGAPNEWEYAGGYWEARERRDWGELETLW